MPQNVSSLVVYYNRDAFKQAGLADPAPDWTYADFTAAAAKLAEIGIAFLELREPGPEGTFGKSDVPPVSPSIRKVFPGPLILNSDFDRGKAIAAVGEERADAISFGRPFISNPDLVARLRPTVARVAPEARTIVFGHVNEGNLHVNVLDADAAYEQVTDAVLNLVAELSGSISSEHGVGRAKTAWLGLSRSATEIAAMQAIKTALDPRGTLNPGVLLPARR